MQSRGSFLLTSMKHNYLLIEIALQVPRNSFLFVWPFNLKFSPEEFTPEKAWEMLNCGYLRLTPLNVDTLEEICSEAGYDVSFHPHKSTTDIQEEMQNIFSVIFSHRNPIIT